MIEQQLVTRNKLQQLNYELIIKRQKTRMYSMLVVVVFVGVLVSFTFISVTDGSALPKPRNVLMH